jgi:flagellar biosynthesis protein FlhF
MKIKRFVAKSMREAIRLVRDEQGPDAVILSNRRVPGGVEVVAATDYDAALAHQALRQQAPVPPPASPDQPKGQRPQREPAEVSPPAAAPQPAAPAVASVASSGASAAELALMQRELGSMRRLLEQELSGLVWNEMKRSQPHRAAMLRALAGLGVDPDLARAIAQEVPARFDDKAARARYLPQALLARRIPVGPADPVLEGGVIALVGPTGAGKTTTIAKLAARFAQYHRPRDIALVSLDHYRIGAQEQIHSYARKLGVFVRHVEPDQDLGAVLDQLADCRLVLLDTAGMSPRDRVLLQQLERIRQLGERVRSYVVLSADMASPDEVIRRFAAVKPVGCLLTKMDEATSLGALLSAVIRHMLPLSYVAHGQRVPEDLYPAQADRLVLCAAQMARTAPRPHDDDSLALRLSQSTPTTTTASIHA